MLTRKEFVVSSLASLTPFALGAKGQDQSATSSVDDLKKVLELTGVDLSEDELKSIQAAVRAQKSQYEGLRGLPITYLDEPPLVFHPLPGRGTSKKGTRLKLEKSAVKRPATEEDIAFLSARELGELIRTKQITSLELTEIYLKRLKKYGDQLLCVVTLTEDLARSQAKWADKEIKEGKYRGPLHGVPCGVKDLLATKGIPTTWGAEPYKDQIFDYDATVIKKLEAAGAVLLAKLSMGALAQGDVWFKGRTKNPWDQQRGSSGSSAGSASAVAAGLVGFAIGTETLGSITSPCNECKVTGLRPTYGRVSRYGAMAVSWTMDKIGPICRSVEDCAIVFAAIHGADGLDFSCVDRPFVFEPGDFKKMKVAAIAGANETADATLIEKYPHLQALRSLGVEVTPIKVEPYAQQALLVLGVEAAAAFDEFTRTDMIDSLKDSAWPATYRSNRFVPAVEYLRAQQARRLMMRKFEAEFGDYDAMVTTGIGNATIRTTNLTGHPQVIIPFGERSVSLVGRLYEDDRLCALGWALQKTQSYHRLRPAL